MAVFTHFEILKHFRPSLILLYSQKSCIYWN